MKNFLLGMVLALSACAQVPVTDRSQLNLLPASELQQMSYQQYNDFLAENELSSNRPWQNTVKEVGNNIARAVEAYMRETGNAGRVSGFDWAFNLVEGDDKNAFAMPGGKVVVYEGIMQLVDGDATELATVMSHEIAHVVAEHGNERMSQQMLTQLGGVALTTALGQKPEQTQQLFMAAYGMGAQVGILLPYSRTHEAEADKLGLIFMAKAGYDPRAALDFWQKMAAASQGERPPQFLSSHPSHANRIDIIRDTMPRALEHYRQN